MNLITPSQAIIGMQGPVYEVEIERGRIRQFAKSIYCQHPAYHQDKRAVVPPTS